MIKTHLSTQFSSFRNSKLQTLSTDLLPFIGSLLLDTKGSSNELSLHVPN